VLDISQGSFTWTLPYVSGLIGDFPIATYGHTAIIYRNYMVTIFGRDTQTPTSSISILNTDNYTWVESFDFTPPPGNENTKKIIGGVAGGVFGLCVIVGGFCLYRKRRIARPITTAVQQQDITATRVNNRIVI